jgi:hypothetical protein
MEPIETIKSICRNNLNGKEGRDWKAVLDHAEKTGRFLNLVGTRVGMIIQMNHQALFYELTKDGAGTFDEREHNSAFPEDRTYTQEYEPLTSPTDEEIDALLAETE